jgi:Flp pilus assembly protein TadG
MFRCFARRLWVEEKGIAVALFALILPVCFVIAGLVIDGGMLAYKKLKLSAAVDAASLAAVNSYDKAIWNAENRIVIDSGAVSDAANKYLAANMEEARITEASIEENTGTFVKVAVKGEVTVPLYFAGVFKSEKEKTLTVRTVSSIKAPEEEEAPVAAAPIATEGQP